LEKSKNSLAGLKSQVSEKEKFLAGEKYSEFGWNKI